MASKTFLFPCSRRASPSLLSIYAVKLTNKNVTWSSDHIYIASVTPDGVLNGHNDGQTIIYAKTARGCIAKCTVNVEEIRAKTVKVDPASVTIAVGESVSLNATIIPERAYNKSITWSSKNETIASVSSSGVVKGIKPGKTYITAKAKNNKNGQCVVTVTPLPSKVTLNRTTATITAGKSVTLKATVTPSAADKTVIWSSSDEAIAVVSSTGVVKGIKKGTATITVKTKNGKIAKCVVKVLSK